MGEDCPFCREDFLVWYPDLGAFVCSNQSASDIGNVPCNGICGLCKYCTGLLVPNEITFDGGPCSWICNGCNADYPVADRGRIDVASLTKIGPKSANHPQPRSLRSSQCTQPSAAVSSPTPVTKETFIRRKGKTQWKPAGEKFVGFVSSTSSEGHITYGLGKCLSHMEKHSDDAITESDKTRYLISSVVRKLKECTTDSQWDPGFMVGVLIVGEKIIIATSGAFGGPLLRHKKKQLLVESSNVHIITWASAEMTHSVGGVALPPAVRKAKEEITGRLANVCAAPKIIDYARKQDWLKGNTTINMSEMWFGAQPEGGRWRHGQAAQSCTGCKKVLPSLLCRMDE